VPTCSTTESLGNAERGTRGVVRNHYKSRARRWCVDLQIQAGALQGEQPGKFRGSVSDRQATKCCQSGHETRSASNIFEASGTAAIGRLSLREPFISTSIHLESHRVMVSLPNG